jgi:hypothetical protein
MLSALSLGEVEIELDRHPLARKPDLPHELLEHDRFIDVQGSIAVDGGEWDALGADRALALACRPYLSKSESHNAPLRASTR